MFKGRATLDATSKFLEKSKNHKDQIRDFCGVKVSSLAIGTYLGQMDEATDLKVTNAILSSIESGVNFIDTAINYRGQRAERSIAEAFKRGLLSNKFKREEIFVSTKGGFIPYESTPTKDMLGLFDEEYVKKGVAKKSDLIAGCHCMEPSFIKNQIERSLKNLGLETIDLYYLHNPETQLEELPPRIFYEKLTKAFETLEIAVREGMIAGYGMATWDAFRTEASDQTFVSLELSVACAEKAAEIAGNSKHSFKAIQLPLNLATPEAAMLASQKIHHTIEKMSKFPAINAARELGLGVAISAPLLQGRLCHDLPEFILRAFPKDYSQAHCALAFASSFPAVNAVMLGMKDPAHIRHNLEYLKCANLSIEALEQVVEAMMEKK